MKSPFQKITQKITNLPFLLSLVLVLNFLTAFAQPQFPCNGKFLFTRQYPTGGPNSYISQVDFIPGDINISNPGTIAGGVNVNASVLSGGYIWSQNWNNTTAFELLRIAADYTTTPFVVAGMTAGTTYNNAGVDRNGIMYILTNSNPVNLFAINLVGTPTLVTGYPKVVTGFAAADAVIWGDIAIDPVTNRTYCWYHPTGVTSSLLGLYEITNITTTPVLTKIGVASAYTLGSLFFNDRGQLFGYGGTLGSTQDRIFAIDKAGGTVTQYGLPDLAVTQTDGSACSFRLSLDRQVSVPFLSIQKCSVDTFSYTFTPRNYSTAGATNISFSDTLDSRLTYVFNTATLQTQLQVTYGAAVVVMVSSFGGGTNNVVNITGMNLPIGSNSFTLPVKVDANNFSASATITEQAFLKNVATNLGGPNEPSNDPTTFNPKDFTALVITFSGSKCLPPIANNFINNPMPQGNGATVIPALTASDPDGTITNYTLLTVPTAAQGILSVPCLPTPTGATCTGGFADLTAAVLAANPGGIVLTPTQVAAMRFDPTANFTGNALFTFNATDNSGNTSNTATYTLPVTAQPPVSNNIMEASMPNFNGPTAIQGLNSADVDGTIAGYKLTTIPTAAQGVLSVPCGTVPDPTPAGATCTGGFANLTAAVLTANPTGIPLTATQMAAMRFDPTAGFLGNATFNYNATDNSGNISNTANYTIPVTAAVSSLRPPLADNITAQPINNSLGPVAIPALKANDFDGLVASYTITSVPNAADGVLSVSCPPTPAGAACTGGFADLTPAVLAANPTGIVLTPAQRGSLRFDPAPGFIGNASFGYTATDNSGLVSNRATYTIPVVNTPPVAVNINTIAAYNGPAAAIIPLSGSDADGTIASFTITTVPTAAQGVLSVPCGTLPNPTPAGATCTGGFADLTPTVLAANPLGISLTPTQAAAIRFDPATGFSGTAPFNYTTTDNNGLVSTSAIYTITIPNQPPVSNDITIAVIPNTNGVTAINPLSSTDPDGTISGYTIYSVPPPTSGILSMPCPFTFIGATCTAGFQDITATVIANYPAGLPVTATQMAGLRFDPADNYTGVVNFTYNATDNSGNASNVANYNIPISGVGNLPPIAQNIVTASMPSTNIPTAILPLVGSDPDGTVANFTITTLPPASQGVLSIPCGTVANPTPAGATCTGGFADLTAAVLAANPAGIVLTATQASGLRFDPSAGFAGNVTFSYFDTDNAGLISNFATYTIPVTGTPPVSNPIVAAAMPQTNGAIAIPGLVSSDADGTIASYQIETLPPTTQGVISVPCPVTLIGATCSPGNFQDLTAAVLANYPSTGIPLTATQMAGMRFDPSGSFSGNVVFNYHATDNSGLISNSTTYTIPVTGQPPVSYDTAAPKMLNANGPTLIPGLKSNDPDGSISSYLINSVPPISQGVLSIPCPPTPNGATCAAGFADLTAAVLAANPGGISLTPTQMAGMRFDPTAGFIGNAIFNYSAVDNNGNLSNVATYLIPVDITTVLPYNSLVFTGNRKENDIVVNWKTEGEINVGYYDVEYSTDGNTYKKGGTVSAQNMALNNYHFTLNNYTEPLYYIRLKITDVSGRISYSNIVVIKMKGNNNDINIYPNPATTFVNISFGFTAKGDYTLQLIDATGRTIKTMLQKNVQPNQLLVIERGNINSGIYVLKIINHLDNTSVINKLIWK